MDDNDIEAFIKAKKQLALSEWMAGLALLPLAALMVINSMDQEVNTFPLLMLVFGLLAWSQGPNRLVATTRRQLVGIIERQINRDPAALKRLSEKRESREHLA